MDEKLNDGLYEQLLQLTGIVNTINYELQDIEIIKNLRIDTKDLCDKFDNLKALKVFYNQNFDEIKTKLDEKLAISSLELAEENSNIVKEFGRTILNLNFINCFKKDEINQHINDIEKPTIVNGDNLEKSKIEKVIYLDKIHATINKKIKHKLLSLNSEGENRANKKVQQIVVEEKAKMKAL